MLPLCPEASDVIQLLPVKLLHRPDHSQDEPSIKAACMAEPVLPVTRPFPVLERLTLCLTDANKDARLSSFYFHWPPWP